MYVLIASTRHFADEEITEKGRNESNKKNTYISDINREIWRGKAVDV